MKRRGQRVTLQNKKTGEVRTVIVVWADSVQGYLAAHPQKNTPMVLKCLDNEEWERYHPDEWTEIK